jgi:hypothetical protein
MRPYKHYTSAYEKSVSYSGLKLYNSLPDDVKSLCLPVFKTKIKSFLIDNPMYDIREFICCNLNDIMKY